jgi:hypothetical protein
MPAGHDDIDLVREEVREQVDQVVDPAAPQPFGLYASGTEGVVAALARRVEQAIFMEAFGNTPTVLRAEYGRYEDACVFFCVIDHRRRMPVGMARCILPSPAGLKSLDDIGRDWGEDVGVMLARTGLDFDRKDAWDCATIATLPEYRRGALEGVVTMSLYQAVASTPYRYGYRWWLSILDLPVYRLIQWKLVHPFSKYAGVEARSYLGSKLSLPVWADIDEWSARVRRADVEQFERIFGGGGIEPAVKPLDWDAVGALVRRVAGDGPSTRPSSPAGRA